MARKKVQRARGGRDPEFSRDQKHGRLFGKGTGVVLAVLVLVLAVAIIVPVAPQYRKMQEIEKEYANALQEERGMSQKRRQSQLEAQELRSNPEYFKARARDRGPYYRPGEDVIKIVE